MNDNRGEGKSGTPSPLFPVGAREETGREKGRENSVSVLFRSFVMGGSHVGYFCYYSSGSCSDTDDEWVPPTFFFPFRTVKVSRRSPLLLFDSHPTSLTSGRAFP